MSDSRYIPESCAERARGELIEHLAECSAPGRCSECYILIITYAHWSKMSGMHAMRECMTREDEPHSA